MNRRDFLRYMLGTAAAASVDFEQLLWLPKPIIVVPRMPMIGGITNSTYPFWRNKGHRVLLAWEGHVEELLDERIDLYKLMLKNFK